MTSSIDFESSDEERFKEYINKVAAGPKLSKDLTRDEAEDAMTLILNGKVSDVRAGVFLIAARMKIESFEESIGFWKALDASTKKRNVKFDRLLQISDPFDGWNRVPYFGFFCIPLLASLGLPTYGHSTAGMPPKFGITFEDILCGHYGVSRDLSFDAHTELLEEFGFGYLGTRQSNPRLENLRHLRQEMVKRSTLATYEKMLQPWKARAGGNYLASGYFHKGYEVPMLGVGDVSEFDRVILGNGTEGSTLYGIHKAIGSKVFIQTPPNEVEEMQVTPDSLVLPNWAMQIKESFEELKNIPVELKSLCESGEQALKLGEGPAAQMIAWQTSLMLYFCGVESDFIKAFDKALNVLNKGEAYSSWESYMGKALNVE